MSAMVESERKTFAAKHAGAPRVLIADDQPDVLEALRLLLKTEGYQIELVSSPAGVLNALDAVDNAAWRLYAATHSLTDFDSLIPSFDYLPGSELKHERLAAVDECLDRITHLMASLLDVSRLQAGALPVFPGRVISGRSSRAH